MSDRETERQKRLRDALRENLKRRKSQARGRTDSRIAETDSQEKDQAPDDRR